MDVREHLGRQVGTDGRIDTGVYGISQISETPLYSAGDLFVRAHGSEQMDHVIADRVRHLRPFSLLRKNIQLAAKIAQSV